MKIERKSGDSALIGMTQNVAALLDVRLRKSGYSIFLNQQIYGSSPPTPLLTAFNFLNTDTFPDGLFRQMTSCQTAANEFLRQFWSATYPPPVDTQSVLSVATPAQRAAKAAKMIGYLEKTPDKIASLVRMAQQHGVEGSRVETVRIIL